MCSGPEAERAWVWRKEGEGRGLARVWEAGLGRGLGQAGPGGGAGGWLGSGRSVLSPCQQEDGEGVSGESDIRFVSFKSDSGYGGGRVGGGKSEGVPMGRSQLEPPWGTRSGLGPGAGSAGGRSCGAVNGTLQAPVGGTLWGRGGDLILPRY